MLDLHNFLSALRAQGELVEIGEEVDPLLELAEIHRRVAAADGPALLFRRVRGSSFPVVTNLFGSELRIRLAFQDRPEEHLEALLALLTGPMPPSPCELWKRRSSLGRLCHLGLRRGWKAPLLEKQLPGNRLDLLPFLQLWPEDGGSFLTLPLVYTEPPGGGPPNLGIYRMQRFGPSTAGLHWQLGKGGGFHYHQAEERLQRLGVHVFLGGPPALLLSAIAPLPENVPELLLASFLGNRKLRSRREPETGYPLLIDCEAALVGYADPGELYPEGPFGDHYGYYSLQHDFPLFHCQKIYARRDAVIPATVVGKPRQEDFYLGNYLQELLSPLFPIVMPAVRALWSYAETGFHSLTAAVVRERYYRESMQAAFRILGEGQLSLTKFLLVTDVAVDLRDFRKTLSTVLARMRPETDLFLFANLSLDTLDYTGPALQRGSRGVLLGIGDPIRPLPETWQGPLPLPFRRAQAYCPGCLVVEAPPFGDEIAFDRLLGQLCFQNWPLLIAVDSIAKTLKNDASFLWTVFTRFEPAADLHSASREIRRNHISHSGPLLIDARMKPTYPKEVAPDERTQQQVSDRWTRYFPHGLPMGDSLSGHVC